MQLSALKVDEIVLGVKPGDTTAAAATKSSAEVAHAAAARASKATCGSTFSHKWEQQTTTLLQEAQQYAADAARCVGSLWNRTAAVALLNI